MLILIISILFYLANLGCDSVETMTEKSYLDTGNLTKLVNNAFNLVV